MFRSRRFIIKNYGAEFWQKFKTESSSVFKKILLELPDIGKSIFSFNYAYAPSYIAWYKTMRKLGLSAEEADDLMWKMNEKMILTVPKIFLRSAGKIYLESFRKKAAAHIERQKKQKASRK